jgi:decaprenylphospho-beta-D-ribofuranose 2-oxidase
VSEPALTRELTGWGRCTRSVAQLHAGPTIEQARALVATADQQGVLARGMGRSYGDAAQNGGGHVLARIDPFAAMELDATNGRLRVSAGTSLERIQRSSFAQGWRLPVVPGTRFVSVGGAIAADVHGKNHHVDGAFGAWVEELSLIDGSGRDRTLSPASEPQEFWATIGGMGLTGVVTSATLRLVRVGSSRMTVRTRRFDALDDVFEAMSSSTWRYHVAWVDASNSTAFGRAVLDEGEHLADPPDAPLIYAPRAPVPVPPLPANLITSAAVTMFNRMWWRRAPVDTTHTVGYSRFFHPLDGVGHWHRLYGRRGLLQWQTVVPFAARSLLTDALETLTRAKGVNPALVVIKRFGAAAPAPLSFPMPGWTMAVDLPAGAPGLGVVLDALDERIADAGGRVYLAKDSRVPARLLPRMYPRLEQWRGDRDSLDPRRVFQSDLSRRLGL